MIEFYDDNLQFKIDQPMIIYLMKDISRYHPDLEWKKHYETIFSIVFNQFNKLVR